jgi:hypothetical protein
MSSTTTHPGGSPPTSQSPKLADPMPWYIFPLALTYMVVLLSLFAIYVTSPTVRNALPHHFGELPAAVVWFGALGAVLKSLYGVFTYNASWDATFNVWHVSRPVIGAVTGSMGAVIYLVLLKLGNTGATKVDFLTFCVAAFAFGFADSAFLEVLKNVTNILIKPGTKQNANSGS